MSKNYVIRLVDSKTGKSRYYSYDSASGYTVMDGWSLMSARTYTLPEARKVVDGLLSEKSRANSGTEYPPDFIHRGFDLCFAKPRASGYLEIVEVTPTMVERHSISGEIKKVD